MGLEDFLVNIGTSLATPGRTGGIPIKAPTANSQSFNAARVAMLKKLGYSNNDIAEMIKGNIAGTGYRLGSDYMDVNMNIPGIPGAGWLPSPIDAVANLVGGGKKVPGIPSKGSGVGSGGSTAGNILSKILGTGNFKTIGNAAQGLGRGAGNLVEQIVGAVQKKNAGKSSTDRTTGNTAGTAGGIDFGGLDYPEWNYTPPELVMRDFTDEANSKVAAAFAPLMAMYAQQKLDTQARGDRNFQTVGGIYDKYVNSIGADAANTQQRFDTAEAQRAQQGTDLAGNVGNYYQSANQNTADLLKAIGGQQAAPELLQQGANEQAIQQGNIAQNTQAVNDYYGQQEQGAANQAVAYQDAARNEGVRGQSNVLADTSALLSGIGQQQAQSQTQQGMTALDIAKQLADRDFQMQQGNAGMGLDAAKMGYQSQIGAYDASRQNILDQLSQNQWQQEMAAKNRQFEQEMDLKRQGLNLDTQKFNWETSKPGEGITPSGDNSVQLQLSERFGPNAVSDMAQAMYDVTADSNVRPGDPNMSNAYNAFMQRAQQLAAGNDMSMGEAVQAMQAYWNSMQAGAFGATPRVQVP